MAEKQLEKKSAKRKKSVVIVATFITLILVVSALFTWQMSNFELARAPLGDMCEAVISGVPLPVNYSARQYSFIDSETNSSIFVTCVWPEYQGVRWANLFINWFLYSTLSLSILNLFYRKRTK